MVLSGTVLVQMLVGLSVSGNQPHLASPSRDLPWQPASVISSAPRAAQPQSLRPTLEQLRRVPFGLHIGTGVFLRAPRPLLPELLLRVRAEHHESPQPGVGYISCFIFYFLDDLILTLLFPLKRD